MTCCDKDLELLRVTYRPNFDIKLITPKFYARHDHEKDDPEVLARIPHYLELIEQKRKFDLRKERLSPITENQVYGWLERRVIRYTDPLDSDIFNHCITQTEQMREEKQIQVQSRLVGRR